MDMIIAADLARAKWASLRPAAFSLARARPGPVLNGPGPARSTPRAVLGPGRQPVGPARHGPIRHGTASPSHGPLGPARHGPARPKILGKNVFSGILKPVTGRKARGPARHVGPVRPDGLV